MATQHTDNEPFIVDKFFKLAVAGAQEKYKIQIDVRVARRILFAFLREWDGTHETYHPTKSRLLDTHLYPSDERSPYTSFLNRYLKLFPKKNPKDTPKNVQPVTASDWEEVEKSAAWSVWVCERTKEIHLFHNPTMSRSESLFNTLGFELGSVVVEGQPSKNKGLVEVHRNKCFETTYRILSGK